MILVEEKEHSRMVLPQETPLTIKGSDSADDIKKKIKKWKGMA